ncbi:MAG TPA: gamma-glutamylcyclotransferase family protein [Gemmatimonadota bacterium]|nr:gamma-glutamylcyclotransferase family protein [Gemmatimonadota bacterium]
MSPDGGLPRLGADRAPDLPRTTRVLGYGTLLSRASLGRTVGEHAVDWTTIPVVVEGWRRLFDFRPEHYEPSFRLKDEPVEAAALNIEPAPGSRFNGLVIEVSDRGLEALDSREAGYRRVRVPVLSWPDGEPAGEALAYAVPRDDPRVCTDPARLLPRWLDVELSRAGAYEVGRAFGALFDQTTYLADGETLLADAWAAHLPDPRGD